jgi:hypothetical protein
MTAKGITRTLEATIELRLSALAQLFNSLDPSPFHERDLDDDAEAYIVGWARELPRDSPFRIVLHLPEREARTALERDVAASLVHYFAERAAVLDRDLKDLFRIGRRNLSISVPLLIACLAASHFIRLHHDGSAIGIILQESLIIVGWVANWRPIETFLYDWWPIARRRDLYRRLATATVEIRMA